MYSSFESIFVVAPFNTFKKIPSSRKGTIVSNGKHRAGKSVVSRTLSLTMITNRYWNIAKRNEIVPLLEINGFLEPMHLLTNRTRLETRDIVVAAPKHEGFEISGGTGRTTPRNVTVFFPLEP